GVDGILVPGGFGSRGTAGMVAAAEFARQRGVPYFGICYGFQWAVTEYARNVCGLGTANSTEVDPDTEHKVIYKLQDLLGVDAMGGTMRLGSYVCELRPGSRAAAIYGATEIRERHRHRYEFNQAYESCLTQAGLTISGKTPDGKFVEIAEITPALGIPFIFKAGYDKANRSRLGSYRGPGIDEGLEILAGVRARHGVPILTDVHEVAQVEKAARVADVLQIPAFLCRQTDLVVEAARTGRIVNVKKGQFMAPWDMKGSLEKAAATGNRKVMVTERGFTFGYNNLVVDMRSFSELRALGF